MCKTDFVLQREVSAQLWRVVERAGTFDVICGVPYTALPIATVSTFRSGRIIHIFITCHNSIMQNQVQN